MLTENSLSRYLTAQERDYPSALGEIKKGRKTGHWMWYIFPQIAGLGFRETSKYYAIKNANEAVDYINNPVLGTRLVEICEALLALPSTNATGIFGSPDDMKLRSSVTLFATLPNASPVFQQVLDKFFNGKKDEKTIKLLETGHREI